MDDPSQHRLDAPASAAQGSRSRLAGLRAGAKAPFCGLSFLIRNPRLWPLALVPMAVASAIFLGGSCLSVLWLPRWIESVTGPGDAWYQVAGVAVLQFAAALSGVLLSVLLAVALAQPLSGPALERLVRAMQEQIGATQRPQVPWWRDMGRSSLGAAVGLAVTVPLLTVLFLVDLTIPLGWVIAFPLKLIVTGMFITWDLMDYPFSVRGWRIGIRARWIRSHLGSAFGFGLSLAVIFLIPGMQLLLLPVGAVGATWLLHQIDPT